MKGPHHPQIFGFNSNHSMIAPNKNSSKKATLVIPGFAKCSAAKKSELIIIAEAWLKC